MDHPILKMLNKFFFNNNLKTIDAGALIMKDKNTATTETLVSYSKYKNLKSK